MNDLEVLDEPNDVTGVKRARAETEAEGAPDPKFAKFDNGACLCVCVYERERVRIFGVRYPQFENTHSREYIQTYFIHPLPPHIFFFSLPLQELSPRKDPGWWK
jgi:hypothetical protein